VTVPFQHRFNFKKANCSEFANALIKGIKQIEPTPQQYNTFVESVKKILRKYIHRCCRTEYILGMKKSLIDKLHKYREIFSNQPFKEETDSLLEELMEDIENQRKK